MRSWLTWGGTALAALVAGFALGGATRVGPSSEAGVGVTSAKETYEGRDATLTGQLARWGKMDAAAVRDEYLSALQRGEKIFASVLLERLAELDVDLAFAALPEDSDGSAVFAAWAKTDPDAAEAEVRRRLDEDIEDDAMAVVVAAELTVSDPERALEIMRAADLNGYQIDRVFLRWTYHDTAAATRAAMAWSLAEAGEISTGYLDGIIEELVHRDPMEALRWFAELPKEWRTDGDEIAEEWAELDSRSAFAALQAGLVADREMADNLAYELLEEDVASLSLEEIRYLFENFEGTQYALEEVSYHVDGRDMAELIDIRHRYVDEDVVSTAAGEWAETEPRAAAEWVFGLKEHAGLRYPFGAVFGHWVDSEPSAALSYLASRSGEFEEHASAVWDVMEDYVGSGRGLSVADGIAALPQFSPEAQQVVERGLVERWALGDPEGAVAYALERGVDGLVSGAAAGHWESVAEHERAGVAEQYYALAAAGEPVGGLRAVASLWMIEAPGDASRWAAELRQGHARDVVAMSVAEALRTEDPEASYRWAETLGEIEGRSVLLEDAWEGWVLFDPEGAAAYSSSRDP